MLDYILYVKMDNNNYLDIPVSIRDNYIYRFISVERLIELFERNKNGLVKPHEWKDPFENFIQKSKMKLPTGDIKSFDHDNCYGQCWTRKKVSDAMWRIYSPNEDAVRIRSTIRKVGESLSTALGNKAPSEAFIGKVLYLRDKKLTAFANDIFKTIDHPDAITLAKTLLIKRRAFSHEQEIRLLYFPIDVSKRSGDHYFYNVNPHTLIDQIMIDPRIKYEKFKQLREKIKNSTGFTGSIRRSLLYKLPPEFIEAQ